MPRAILVLCCGVLLALTLHSALVHSAVCDEIGAHIPAGYLYWTSGRYSGGLDNFPLGQLLVAAPVRALSLPYELWSEQHLLLFRLPVVLLTLVFALATVAYTRMLFGGTAAQVALVLLTACPNVLAHGSLATLDLPLACFVLLALLALLRYVTRPSTLRLAVFSIALALALATKIQALLLLPLAALVLAVTRPGLAALELRARLLRIGSWLLLPAAASTIVLGVSYRHLPLVSGGLLPEPFLQAIAGKLLHGASGHFSYLLGRYSATGFWQYFPVAIAAKTALGTLLLAAVGLLARPTRATLLFVILPGAAFLAVAMAGRVDIGLRHVLTIYPLLFALAGHGAVRLWRSRLRPLAPLLVAWSVLATARVAPHYLSYFNELAGGPLQGHRVLIDSNYDWGQNDGFLRRWLATSQRSCRIDPDPFAAVGGCVVVNANALHGLLNGGAAAYPWLRGRQEQERIAYTWFVYELPDAGPRLPRPRPWLDAQRHLLWLRQSYGDVRAPAFREALATAFAVARAYPEAFAEIDDLLARDPARASALALGGELTVRRKLGALSFEDDQYLRGFAPAPPAAAVDDATLARLAAVPAASRSIGRTHYALAGALVELGRTGEAASVLRGGLVFEGARDEARELLRALDAGTPPGSRSTARTGDRPADTGGSPRP